MSHQTSDQNCVTLQCRIQYTGIYFCVSHVIFRCVFLIGFCVSQNETKRKVDFEDGGLISEDPAQLFAGSEVVDGRKAEIVPVLKSVVAAKSGTDLGPVLAVRLSNIFVRA